MTRRWPFVLLVIIVVGGGLLWLSRDVENVDVEALARNETLREMGAQSRTRQPAIDLDELARQGRGQPVPDHLRTTISVSDGFWIVEHRDSPHQAQLPFAPGKLPTPPPEVEPKAGNPGFLGADACQSCHAEKHASFVHTAHFRTSRPATLENISGSFESGKNRMSTRSPDIFFTMIHRDGSSFQRVSFFDWQFEVPFDLIFGSSKMGESYLYWHGDRLYQMNCTYLSESDRWINSPGYGDGNASYARPILPGCIDCHATYADVRQMPNRYSPSSLILGISCERCHGPGKEHVEFHHANPEVKVARHTSVPSRLPRQAQIDLCGQCHTSNKKLNDRPPFQFRPGDRLAQHYDVTEEQDTTNEVHTSNQAARLAMSECFQQSEMACVECHDPHRNERGQLAIFSERCLKCHEQDHCGFDADSAGIRLSDNCIDCHMPRGAGRLHVETAEGTIFPPLRDHYIRVDQPATAQFITTE